MAQWVRLAVEKLNSCHTQPDVELALQHLPLGMRALYDRMAQSIAENSSPTSRTLAASILQVVTCSLRVLTVTELFQALNEQTSQILDFQRAITDLCGGFVVIDNDGNVTMIHQTAREYLLGHDFGLEQPFRINAQAAHDHVFLSCMRCLTSIGLRAKLNRNQKPDFLEYAATAWSSHLLETPTQGAAFETLQRFLTGHSVLTWIQAVAMNKQLRALIRASKHLSKYSKRHENWDAQHNPIERRTSERELIDSWALDMVKIVGKFGANLRRNPESIHKVVAPFCPKGSSIYQQFGKKEAKNLVVSGLSEVAWNDSLARISLRSSTFASSILAFGTRISILDSSATVSIYDSSTFEETNLLKHGERVYIMQMNSAGTWLTTYGYRTTKVWELSTGTCKITVPNPESRPRPLAILFVHNDDAILAGTDDKRISSLDLRESDPAWHLVTELEEPELEGHFLNAPSYMCLNSDGTLVAVAYRGHPLSAWEVDGPEHIGHCWRTRDVVARGEVIQAVWHPYNEEILGLYIEGVVFKWRPYDDEISEIAIGASRLSISKDGGLLVTGDVNGTVKVFSTADFYPIYQISSQDTVFAVAFGPDPHRFYDIRGSCANAWEPSALVQFAEQTKRSSDLGSEFDISSHFSASTLRQPHCVDSITVLAASPSGRFYCYGTEEGTVYLYETQQGKCADIHSSKSFMSIEQLAWSNDGRYLCFSDSSKKLFIISIASGATSANTPAQSKVEVSVSATTNGHILQLLFHPASSHLMVYTSSIVSIVSLASFAPVQSLDWHDVECRWTTHPQNSALMVGVAPRELHVIDWNLLDHRSYAFEYPLSSLAPTTDGSGNSVIDEIILTHDKKHLLCQCSVLSGDSKEKAVFLLNVSWVSPPETSNEQEGTLHVTPTRLPTAITTHVLSSLSFLSNNRYVYLSKDFSICYSSVLGSDELLASDKSTTPAETKQLFSLPGDWISRDCLALCTMWPAERSLLCPRNGEIAIVKSAALA
ncbi:MAG: hypothetical protein Q9227_007311 [Pyrenula ochraceoflavens]